MTLAILGLGTALPSNSVTQAEAAAAARVLACRTEDQAAWLPALYRHTEIETRHLVFDKTLVGDVLEGKRQSHSEFLPSGTADDQGPGTGERMLWYRRAVPPLALGAAGQALERSGLAPEAVTHLVTVSCTGFFAPGMDVVLMKGLRLAPTVQRTHVGFMGCHGALNGLRVARAFTGADPAARVLVCAVELCSLHYHYGWDLKKVVANALFADGAAALVGAPAGASPAGAWQVAATGSCLFPDSEHAMTWNIGDHGFEMTLSRRVPDLLARELRPWLVRWLGQNGLGLEAIRSWAVHPGGPRILSAVEQALGIPEGTCAVSREVFACCGNMSSPTVLFILDRLRSRQAPRPCLALGFGPGLVAEAALFL